MTLYGPDLSNNNWSDTGEIAGWLDDCFHREGFSFLEHKVSEGNYYSDPYWPVVRDWCATNNVPCIGYHYVTTNPVDQQVQRWLSNGGGPNVMLDFEANSGDINNFWAIVNAFNAAGVDVRLSYLPYWYWKQIGSPDISGAPGLISSGYYNENDYASTLYAEAGGDTGMGWWSYGGNTPVIWQFADGAVIDGKRVDANAFKGSTEDLWALFSSQSSNTGVFMALSDQEQAQLLADVADIKTQLRGPNLAGWPQLGQNAQGEDLTVVDALAAIESVLAQIKTALGLK